MRWVLMNALADVNESFRAAAFHLIKLLSERLHNTESGTKPRLVGQGGEIGRGSPWGAVWAAMVGRYGIP